MRLLEKQYNEDRVIKSLRQQRIDIIEVAIPVSINQDWTYVFDESTQHRLDYLEKQLNDYIMKNYISRLNIMSKYELDNYKKEK